MEDSKLSLAQKILFLCACLSVGTAAYTNTALMTAIPVLIKTFSLTPTLAQWTIDLFLVVSVSLIIPAGKLAERFGVAKFFSLGLLLFMIGSIAVALSQQVSVILIGRAFEGAGFGFMMPLALQMLKQALPESFHNTATAVWAGMLSLGFGLGPTVGGFFVSFGSWRGIFWLSAGLMLLYFALMLLSLPGIKFQKKEGGVKAFHFTGFVTFTVAVVTLVFFLIEVQRLGFSSGFVDLVLFISIVSFVIFYFVSKDHDSPYVQLFFLKNRETFLSVTGVFFTMFALFQTLYFYSAYLQNYYTMGLSAVLAGASLLLVSLVIFLLSLFIAKVAQKISERKLKILGMLFTTFGFLLLFLFSEVHGFLWWQLASVAMLGVGMGISYPLFPGSGLRSVSTEHIGSLSGVISVASGLGCAVGVAMGGIVYQIYFKASMHIGQALIGLKSADQVAAFANAAHAVTPAQAEPLLTHLPQSSVLAIQYAVGSGFSHTMLLCALVTIIRALIGTFWMKSRGSSITH